MTNVVIVDGVRSAIGAFGKSLRHTHASDLGGTVLKEAIKRSGVQPEDVEEAIFGCVGQVGENAFIARTVALNAGMPNSSTAMTVNRLCSSGLQSIVTASQTIKNGDATIVAAGGVETMSQLPYYVRNTRFGEKKMGDMKMEDGLTLALSDPFYKYHMGVTAENVVGKFGITREEQDDFAYDSQKKAAHAIEQGYFKEEIVPIEVKNGRTTSVFAEDEFVRKEIEREKLAKLPPSFKEGGSVTAANSSGINDGAAALILMSEEEAVKRGLKPKMKFINYAVSGVDPAIMGIGPTEAIKKALDKAGLSLKDIDLFELNEAFASQSIAVIREADLDINKVNVNGGAIAMGHPIGASGAIITIKLMNEMIRRNVRYGLATLCIGGGQGLAAIFENLHFSK